MSESKQRDMFTFYRSFKEGMNELSDADRLIMYEAISDYSLDMKEPELTGSPKALLSIIRPIIDANWQRYNNGCKGGTPKGNKNNRFSKSTTEVQPNKSNNDNNKEEIVREKSISLFGRTGKFRNELIPFVEEYGKDMVPVFLGYWGEPNQSKTKVKFEMQKTWDITKRLRTRERRNNEK